MQKTTKILAINATALILLLVLLLFFIQKRGQEDNDISSIEELAERAMLEKNIKQLYTEAKDKPYYKTHPEELEQTQIKISSFRFTKTDDQGIQSENTQKEFTQGQEITFTFDVYDYMNPKVKDNYYVYGMKIWAHTYDSQGNTISSLTQQMAEAANYHEIKDMIIGFNMAMLPGTDVKTGEYTLKITAWDRISDINTTTEDNFKII